MERTVLMYSRPGCGLCDETRELLGALLAERGQATILLIGSNVVLLGVASWRRFRSKKGTQPIG